MSVSEIVTGSLGGVGTVAVLYALRLMRRLVASVTTEVKAIVAAPAEVKELRAAVLVNTAAISNQSAALDKQSEALGHLSAALEGLTRIAEQAGS